MALTSTVIVQKIWKLCRDYFQPPYEKCQSVKRGRTEIEDDEVPYKKFRSSLEEDIGHTTKQFHQVPVERRFKLRTDTKDKQYICARRINERMNLDFEYSEWKKGLVKSNSFSTPTKVKYTNI